MVPREETPSGLPYRSSRSRRAATRAAALSADNKIMKLTKELEKYEAKFEAIAQACGFGGAESWKLIGRLLAAAPAVKALLGGEVPDHVDVHRRNTALHAAADIDYIHHGRRQ